MSPILAQHQPPLDDWGLAMNNFVELPFLGDHSWMAVVGAFAAVVFVAISAFQFAFYMARKARAAGKRSAKP